MHKLITPVLAASACLTYFSQRESNQLYSIDPETEDDLKLIQVIGVVRHGARAPIGDIPNDQARNTVWNNCLPFNTNIPVISPQQQATTSYIPHLHFELAALPNEQSLLGNCVKGQLTREGMNQMELLGTNFYREYGTWLKQLIQQQQNNNNGTHERTNLNNIMFVRATDVSSRRTELSAHYFLHGFLDSLFVNNNVEPPTIHRYEYTLEDMYPNTKLCPAIGHLMKYLKAQDPVVHKPEVVELSKELSQLLLVKKSDTVLPSFETLHNSLEMMKYHNKKLPDGITDDHLNRISSVTAQSASRMFHLDEPKSKLLTSLTIGPFLNQILQSMDQTIKSKSKQNNSELTVNNDARISKPLQLYFGHDTTLLPILTTFGILDNNPTKDNRWPQVGSQVIFELYQSEKLDNYFVKMIYNGKPMRVHGNDYYLPYSQFQQIVSNVTPHDYYKLCHASASDH